MNVPGCEGVIFTLSMHAIAVRFAKPGDVAGSSLSFVIVQRAACVYDRICECMGTRARYRRQLEGQRRALTEHKEKVEAERKKAKPDFSLIASWEKTIINIQWQIEKLERRLKP